MRMIKRWGVMTLVVLLVLGSMGAALADDEAPETEEPTKMVEPGSYEFAWLDDLVTFIFYWGFEGDDVPVCESEEPTGGVGGFGFWSNSSPVEAVEDCHVVDVAGPNGQVNHGTMVSSFVHWLKDGGMADLPDELQDLPKGQIVKNLAHDDFGKGFYELDGDEVELAEEDGHGPPDHVIAKKAEKAKGKKK